MKKLLLFAPIVIGLLLTALPAEADCDQCEDLCRLVDEYLQREKGIELYRPYARSTPEAQRQKPPAGKTVVEHVKEEFEKWTKVRKLPCTPIQPPPPDPQNQNQQKEVVETNAETATQDPSCAILWNGNKLEGQTRQDWENYIGCKPISDAVFAHETVHQEHCMRAYYEKPKTAAAFLTASENMAESELQAWTKHKDIVEDAIRQIIHDKGCGWQPTKRQKTDPHAVPSIKQMLDMEKRAFKAAKALGKKKAA